MSNDDKSMIHKIKKLIIWISLKTLLAKDVMKRMKRQVTEWKKNICESPAKDFSEYIKHSENSTIRKQTIKNI